MAKDARRADRQSRASKRYAAWAANVTVGTIPGKRSLLFDVRMMRTTKLISQIDIHPWLSFSIASFSEATKKISFPLLLSRIKSVSGLLVYPEKSPTIASLNR